MAVLVAVLGTPVTPAATLDVFQNGWIAIAGFSLAAAVAAAALLTPRRQGMAVAVAEG